MLFYVINKVTIIKMIKNSDSKIAKNIIAMQLFVSNGLCVWKIIRRGFIIIINLCLN